MIHIKRSGWAPAGESLSGLHNKLRQQVAAKGKLVRPGFGSPKAVRGFHPCGFPEMLVNNVAELMKAQGFVVRIASACGNEEAPGYPGQSRRDGPQGTESQGWCLNMPGFTTQRRLAASELNIGESRVWINPDPELAGDLSDAITREDIRSQIKDGNIKAKPKKGNSRGRIRARNSQARLWSLQRGRTQKRRQGCPESRAKSSG